MVALLVLGPKRLPEAGRSLGRGLRDFKDALSSDNNDDREIHDELTTNDVAPAATAQSARPVETAAPQQAAAPQTATAPEATATHTPAPPAPAEPAPAEPAPVGAPGHAPADHAEA